MAKAKSKKFEVLSIKQPSIYSGDIVVWDYPERISSYTLRYTKCVFDDGWGEETYHKLERWKTYRKGTFMLWGEDGIPRAEDIANSLDISLGDTEGVMAFLKTHIGLEDTFNQVPVYKKRESEQ